MKSWMSRIRILAVVLVVPVLLVMLQVSNVFAWTGYVLSATAKCTDSGKTHVAVTLSPNTDHPTPGSDGKVSFPVTITGPTTVTETAHFDDSVAAAQTVWEGDLTLAPGSYTVSSTDSHGLVPGKFTVQSCTGPTPTPTPSQSPTPTPTPSSMPTPPATFPQPSVAVACTDSSNATLTVTVTDNGSYAKAGKGNVQVFAPDGSRLNDIPWTWDANGPKTQNIATIQIQGQNTTVNGTWKLVIDGHSETTVQVTVSCSTSGGGSGSGTPGLPDTGLAG